MSKTVHFILQGKGGVGKSTLAIFLAQFLINQEVNLQCVDTDPVNQTFSAMKGLNAKHLEVIEEGTVNQRFFDSLMEEIITSDSDFIIDNGASSFIPLASYIKENEIFELLAEHGVSVFLHTPVVGGAAMRDSLLGMKALASMTTRKNLVVWKNEYFGHVAHEGKQLEEMNVFIDSSDSIFGVICLQNRTASTFGEDMKKMLSANKTFDEVASEGKFFILERSRLKTMQRIINSEIERVGGSAWVLNKNDE